VIAALRTRHGVCGVLLLVIVVLTSVAARVADSAFSDHTKYGTVALGQTKVLQLPVGKIAVAYGMDALANQLQYFVIPENVSVHVTPVNPSAPAASIENSTGLSYSDETGAINSAQRLWFLHVVQAGAYRVSATPDGDGELLFGHDSSLSPSSIIDIGVVLAALDIVVWILLSLLAWKGRRTIRVTRGPGH
jgi:hypothetical protein